MSKSKRIVAPFVNQFGHIIHPEQKVFAVTTCTGRVSMHEAQYVGYVERMEFDRVENKKVMSKFAQIRTPYTKRTYVEVGTKNPFKWSTFRLEIPREQQYEVIEEPASSISTLQYNRILPSHATLSEVASVV